MASWADRRDAYTMQRREQARADQRRNALNEIFASAYEPGETTETPMYGPTQTGAALPPVVQQQPGRVNVQRALADMYRGGFAPEAIQLEQDMRNSELKRMQLGQRPSAVQVYEYYKSLPDDQSREAFLRTLRSPQYGEVGGVRSEMPILPGSGPRPLTTLQNEVSGQAAIQAGKSAADAEVKVGADLSKKSVQAGQMTEYIDRANSLLNNASGSYAGAALSAGKRAIGASDETTQANQQLELISGWMVANVPRMEGPQSNYDVQNYMKMAGMVGDRTVPTEDRRAALKVLRELQQKYAGHSGPIAPTQPKAPRQARNPGDIVNTRNGPMLIQRVNPDGTYEGIPAR